MIDSAATVALYPSSCAYSDDFQAAPYEVVLLNSRAFARRERRGKVCCLNCDNNELLGRLLASGLRLAAAIVIRDGCQEGGNYECVAREGFFGRLLPVMRDRFDYFCDHDSPILDVPARFDEFDVPSHLEPFVRHSDPLRKLRAFHVTPFSAVELDLVLGRIRVRVLRDSIWRGLDSADLVVVKARGSQDQANQNFVVGLTGSARRMPEVRFLGRSRLTEIGSYLSEADKRKLERVAIVPTADGAYGKIVEEIRGWTGEFPREVTFYHLNAGDFGALRSLAD